MDYSFLTEQQLNKKFNSSPAKIKEFLSSEKNDEMVGQICRSHYLDEEKTLMIKQLVVLMALGFIHPKELSLEIQENLYLNYKHARELAEEINQKIFAPIKADLEKVYAPPIPEPERPVVTEIRKPAVSEPQPPLASEVESPVMSRVESPIAEIEKQEITESVSPSIEASPIEVPPIEVPLEAPKVVPEVELPKVEIGEVGPIIIHKEAEFKPLIGTKKSLGGLFGFLKKKEKKKEEAKLVVAKVEIGKEEVQPPKVEQLEPLSVADQAAPKVRVVHYTELRTPIQAEEGEKGEKKKEEKPAITEVKPVVEIKPIAKVPKVEPPKPESTPPKSPEEEIIDLSKF